MTLIKRQEPWNLINDFVTINTQYITLDLNKQEEWVILKAKWQNMKKYQTNWFLWILKGVKLKRTIFHGVHLNISDTDIMKGRKVRDKTIFVKKSTWLLIPIFTQAQLCPRAQKSMMFCKVYEISAIKTIVLKGFDKSLQLHLRAVWEFQHKCKMSLPHQMFCYFGIS